MKPASERTDLRTVPIDPSLGSLFDRLEALAAEPGFRLQREIAFSRALRPYVEGGEATLLSPLPDEFALATLYVLTDYYPEDGQLSLIEQLRDVITVHIPEEERAWLDPVHHSYMDLLEVVATEGLVEGDGLATVQRVTLRSLGDRREFQVEGGQFGGGIRTGQVLLTRLIRAADRVVFPGAAVKLSGTVARSIFEAVDDWRREMEAESGSFALGEWEEFAKRYGYMLLWRVAQTRLKALVEADAGVHYVTQTGQPFLYVLALYEHHEFRLLAEALSQMPELEKVEAGAQSSPTGVSCLLWIQREGSGGSAPDTVSRLTLTETQVTVECNSGERLDQIKHRLASAFGFSLHFRGESIAVPIHDLFVPDLDQENEEARLVVVSPEEEHRVLSAFLESVYLEWADQPAPALHDQTPRHAAASPNLRAQVAALIDHMDRDDLCRRRTGTSGYDYQRLREHVGL